VEVAGEFDCGVAGWWTLAGIGAVGVQVVGRLGVVAANDVKERLGDLLAEQRSALDEWFSAVNRRDAPVARREETVTRASAKVRAAG
jgi:hypothetical protein